AQLKWEGIDGVDGILADLGISSHQIDTPDRGFSIRFDGLLDMRMNFSSPLSAMEVVNDYTESELIRVFKSYGELNQATRM
ncbi:unnamed protein product, partial [Notodromas monacha]